VRPLPAFSEVFDLRLDPVPDSAGRQGSRLPGRRQTVMGSHRLRRSTVLKEKTLLSIGSQAETLSSIRDAARDCRYTDLAV